MELMHRDDRRDDYAFISGSTPQPWYSRNKRKIFGISIAVLVVVVIVVLVATSRSAKLPSGDSKDLFSISWNGSCPWEPDECPQSFQGRPPLLLVSLDGFRNDYLKRGFNPVLQKIAQCGAKADFMYSVFPTKTFPNHFSQVTGLYPSSHGIIDNKMNDSGRMFTLGDGNSQDPFWWEKEPIWVTAQNQGLKAATFFWPGSDVKINGTFPSYYRMYNSETPFEDRVDQVLKWLDLPEDSRPSFLTLYLNQPDTAAHKYGTDSKEVDAALIRVDSMIERLFSGLQQRNLTGCVNIFLMSDHGMTNTDCSNVINLEKYINVSDVDAFLGSLGRLRQKDSENATELPLISDLQCKDRHMRVYKKEQLPVRMHYSSHRRIEPIILEIDNGWTVVNHDVHSGDYECTGGAHGYDNMFPDMRTIFTAIGPSLKRNITVEAFLNIELYELMCELINITANPNNGTRGSLHHLMKEPVLLKPQTEPGPPVTAEVPKDGVEYEERVKAANCSCNQLKQMDVADPSMKKQHHLPFGVPYSAEDNDTLRLLYNSDYIFAFHTKLLMPMWSSFTLNNVTFTKEEVCWTGDARISQDETVRCTDYNATTLKDDDILQRPLYSADFSDPSSREEAEYVTNSIPKSQDHVNALEDELIHLLVDWSERKDLNVVMGPAFDLLGTGVRPSDEEFRKAHEKYGRLIVPSHLFVIATRCSRKVDQLKDCDPSTLDSLSFLLPNHPYPQNCEVPKSVIAKNAARVGDIEKLTGLSFFTGLPIYDAIRLRTRIPHLSM